LSSDAQGKVEAFGRRPYTSIGLSLSGADPKVFNPGWGILANLKEQTITYPAGNVIQKVLDNYQLAYRRPVDIAYCLDGSGSMGSNGGWDGVEASVALLFDPVRAAKYLLQIAATDRTMVLVFSNGIQFEQMVEGNDAPALAKLRGDGGHLSPGGGTAIYDCLETATARLATDTVPGRKKLIVLMTDGQNNAGLRHLPDDLLAARTPVIAIAYGKDADTGTLKSIADKTGGAFIQSSNLVEALRSATAYK